MFAVYRGEGNGCSWSYETLLYVTANESVAAEAVARAIQELEEAKSFPHPNHLASDMEWEEYHEKIKSIFTIDTELDFVYNSLDQITYEYETVKVI